MGSKPAISKKAIVDAAYRRACEHGIGSLGVREVARDCGVAVGTIYNYFPSKADLATEVVMRFWMSVAFGGDPDEGASCFSYREGENLVEFCSRTMETLAAALAEYRADWLRELSSLDTRTRQRGRAAERACFEHILRGFEYAIENDPDVNPDALARIGARPAAQLIWAAMHDALRRGESSCPALLELLKLALYR